MLIKANKHTHAQARQEDHHRTQSSAAASFSSCRHLHMRPVQRALNLNIWLALAKNRIKIDRLYKLIQTFSAAWARASEKERAEEGCHDGECLPVCSSTFATGFLRWLSCNSGALKGNLICQANQSVISEKSPIEVSWCYWHYRELLQPVL